MMSERTDRLVYEHRSSENIFKNVKIKHCTAVEAIRGSAGLEFRAPVKLDFSWRNRLHIRPDGDVWGPQPFLCFRTRNKQYIHDNLDRYTDDSWPFTFDDDTIELTRSIKLELPLTIM